MGEKVSKNEKGKYWKNDSVHLNIMTTKVYLKKEALHYPQLLPFTLKLILMLISAFKVWKFIVVLF